MRERLITFSYSSLSKIALHPTTVYPADTHQSDFPLLSHAPSPPDDNGIYKTLQLWNLQNENKSLRMVSAIENLCMGKWQRPEGHKMSVVSGSRNRDTPMMMIMIGKMMMRMRGMVMRMNMLVMVVIVMVMIMIKRTRMRGMVIGMMTVVTRMRIRMMVMMMLMGVVMIIMGNH